MDLHIAVIADMAVFSYVDAAEEPGEEGKLITSDSFKTGFTLETEP